MQRNLSKPGRNSLCPCGSGVKFKRCHGRLDHPPGINTKSVIPKEILRAIHQVKQKRDSHAAKHGSVKEIITADFKGWRIVAVGSKLHYSKTWRVFTDFLGPYLQSKLGKEWGEKQVKLPLEEQHPVVQWRTIFATHQMSSVPNEKGLYDSKLGSANAWFRLAYDLYLIEQNAELQKRLIRRIREPDKFQGARFEAAVAAMMLAAGYELSFANERSPGKHPEFFAKHRVTGHRLAVEAKSRHRSGILGFEAKTKAVKPQSLDVFALLRDAVDKDTRDPLLVFIELNTSDVASPETMEKISLELEAIWNRVQERAWPAGFPAIGAVFYNDTSPWYLDEPTPSQSNLIWALVLWPNACRHEFDCKPLLQRIARGCLQRCNIPLEFPENI